MKRWIVLAFFMCIWGVESRAHEHLFKLRASDGSLDDYFDRSVALSADIALIGAPHGASRTGAAYVFDVTTGHELRKPSASDGAAYDYLGFSVALSGNFAVVGAPEDDEITTNAGAAYVFDLTAGRQLQKLTAAHSLMNENLGASVAAHGGYLAVGVPRENDLGYGTGSAHIYYSQFLPYGSGCAGSGGITPEYLISGDATPGGVVTLEITSAVGGSVAFILQAFERAAIPTAGGCVLNIAPPIAQLNGPFPLEPPGGTAPGIGWLDIPVAIPASAPVGLTFTTQAFIVDGGVPRGYAATNGVEVTFR
ncbi:MAG: FG-GAP repeat protein [Planctomycetota bacterium]